MIFGRIFMVATGILMMAAGNAMPKLPWLSARFRLLQLDPWQQNRHARFVGKLIVGMGLFFVSLGALLPLVAPSKLIMPAIIGLSLVLAAANFWHIAKLKREPSPHNEGTA